MTLDRNRFLFLAAAIGASSCVTSQNATQDGGPPVTPDGSAPDTSTPSADAGTRDTSTGVDATLEASTDASTEAGACDDDTGDSGKTKYCPISETGAGCLDTTDCTTTRLKVGSELRYFDCLAATDIATCFSEGTPDPRVTWA